MGDSEVERMAFEFEATRQGYDVTRENGKNYAEASTRHFFGGWQSRAAMPPAIDIEAAIKDMESHKIENVRTDISGYVNIAYDRCVAILRNAQTERKDLCQT